MITDVMVLCRMCDLTLMALDSIEAESFTVGAGSIHENAWFSSLKFGIIVSEWLLPREIQDGRVRLDIELATELAFGVHLIAGLQCMFCAWLKIMCLGGCFVCSVGREINNATKESTINFWMERWLR